MASTRLQRTVSSTTNTNIWTYSAWFKRGNLNINDALLLGTFSSTFELIRINSSNQLFYNLYDGSTGYEKITNQLFRDVSAWYNLVISRNGTTVNIYVNGELVTDYATNNTFPTTGYFNTASRTVTVGGRSDDTNYFDGSMTHVHFIDGTVYDASAFGETDATTGIWKAKTAPSVTYGTNGFFLKFENSGSMGTDSSGNANNFTVNGNLTQTIDTPSNVFATMNPLDNYYAQSTFSNGNLNVVTGTTQYSSNSGTLGVSQGKWYWEIEYDSGTNLGHIGIKSQQDTATDQGLGTKPTDWGYRAFNGDYYNNASSTSYGNTYTNGDIISVALDLDNNKLYFAKNGTWQNSGDPTSGATGTGAISITDPASTEYGFYLPAFSHQDGSSTGTFKCNFGNGYFGTTAVASAQNPDDGIGIFEYAVPTGYKALCTKSINAQEYA